jgi:hypothetical protein
METKIESFYDKNEIIKITIDNIIYEFIINRQDVIVNANDYKYIEEASKIIKKNYPYVNKIYSKDNSYFEEFDYVYTFKLPIKIIQPSKFFIDKNIVDEIGDTINEENMYFPVQIINDEYVLLDGHTRLYCLNENYVKMVNVYLYKAEPHISDFVYIAKEGNIKNISSVHVLDHEQYELYWNQLLDQFKI